MKKSFATKNSPAGADEFVLLCRARYGRGWQQQVAADLEVDTSTVRRWVYRGHVPKSVRLAVHRTGPVPIRDLSRQP